MGFAVQGATRLAIALATNEACGMDGGVEVDFDDWSVADAPARGVTAERPKGSSSPTVAKASL